MMRSFLILSFAALFFVVVSGCGSDSSQEKPSTASAAPTETKETKPTEETKPVEQPKPTEEAKPIQGYTSFGVRPMQEEEEEKLGIPKPKLSGDLIIFHAGSLAVPLKAVSEAFMKDHPGVTVKAESAGSRDTARKVSDLNKPCDILASADYQVINDLLIPKFADFNILFASNEMGIAYTSKSKYASEINGENWPEIVSREDVIFGRADPDRDPCGYRTVILFQLAEKHYNKPGLAEKLLAKDTKMIRPKEVDLLALLEAGEIDYLFIYRSVIEQHKLERVALPAEINLSSAAQAEFYSQATVEIAGKNPGEKTKQKGEPIIYAVTIPHDPPNKAAAEAYLELLLSPRGREILKENGQLPILPAKTEQLDKVPESSKQYCQQGKAQ